jgi:single-stranded-DNA-specific exonuclease
MDVTALASAAGGPDLHPIGLALFARRGLTTQEEIDLFLSPEWEGGVHDPALFRGMPAAVERIFFALENGEQITVHGDYDADGVTGSAVLITTLRELASRMKSSAKIDAYIPHRDKEGYGLHPATIDALSARGTNLIITVDCGIACVDEITYAKEKQIDTIVVDHHQFGETLPDGILIHPKLPGESYPFPHLAAVGVAWKLACGLLGEAKKRELGIPDGWEKWLLDLVAIATVTDMVPLVGENRVLERYGLMVMNKTKRPGMKALLNVAGMEGKNIDSETIGFTIGPRINAAGRMDHALLALNLLLSENDEEAARLAEDLEACNRARQKMTKQMMDQAAEQIEATEDDSIVVLHAENWSPSLVGLVAGRYLDQTGKPTIAIGRHEDRWVGSGRSFAAYDITEAVKRAGEGWLTHAGGHVQACGFSFSKEGALEIFIEALRKDAIERLKDADLSPILPVDAEITLEDVDWRLIETVQRFEPFGEGNRRPVFVSRGLEVASIALMGSTQNHVRAILRSPGGRMQPFIGFKFGPRIEEFQLGSKIDVAYDVGINEWNGRKDIQCKLVDVKSSAT